MFVWVCKKYLCGCIRSVCVLILCDDHSWVKSPKEKTPAIIKNITAIIRKIPAIIKYITAIIKSSIFTNIHQYSPIPQYSHTHP